MMSAYKVDGIINGYEYVDLGLSVKWATCNVGASSPEEYGDLYSWGETEPKRLFTAFNSNWFCVSSTPKWYLLNKFDLRTLRVVDGRDCLTPVFDAARQRWNGPWRMPTKKEFDELKDSGNCKWERVTQRGVEGYKVTGYRTGNSIFLPATGFGRWYGRSKSGKKGKYWSSTDEHCLYVECPKDREAIGFGIGEYEERFTGMAVRPVVDNASADGQTSIEPSESHQLFATLKNILLALGGLLICGLCLEFWALVMFVGFRLVKAAFFVLAVVYALLFGKCKESVSPADGRSENIEYVDLGLSVKWARCNLGADTPYDAGDYFAWGEVTPKLDYSWPTYLTTPKNCGTDDDPLNEYVRSGKSIAGTECDAASMRLGGKWRMPTWKEMAELFDPKKCKCVYYGGDRVKVAGYKITSKINGRSIFLPTAGYHDATKTRDGFAYQTATYRELALKPLSIGNKNNIKGKLTKVNINTSTSSALVLETSNAYTRGVPVPQYSFIKELFKRIWDGISYSPAVYIGFSKQGKAVRCLGLPIRPVLDK